MNPQSQSCEPMLRESVKHFLTAYRSGNSDFSVFQSIFFRLIQTMPDPPLEIVWFYSAVTFHAAKLTPGGPLNEMLVLAKDLFQLLISCNNSSNGLKRSALLAPVVYVLYESSKNGLYLGWEAEDLLDKIFGYIQMGCCDDSENCNESEHLVVCFEDLVRVWTVDRAEEGCAFEENLKVLFPVLGDGEVWKGIDGRYGIDRLAGIVLCEVFWLRLCLKIRLGISAAELQKDLKNCTVQTIKGYQNSYFLDMLLRMLLEPTMPISNLRLSSEDAVSLMTVLYDTVLLVDCSFLNSGRWIQLLDNQSRNLALMWSLVADNAIQFAGALSDHVRALSYANAFCKSQLSSQLIKWLSSEAGIEEKCRPHIGNPKDLIRWAFVLEDKGLGVFDGSITRAVASKLARDSTLPRSEIDVTLMTVLYDTVLLVDCSFLNSGRWIQLPDNQSRNLSLMWSLVADNAIQFARALSDHVRALSYANAFCKSQLSSQLIKWLSSEAGIEEKCRPRIGNPKDLIRWALVLEDKGLGVFDGSIIRAVASKLARDSTLPRSEIDVALSSRESIFSYSGDSKKCEGKASLDEEMVDPLHDTADPAAVIGNERSSEGRKKRKEEMREIAEPRVKLVKYNFHENSIYNNKYSSGVEMGSPVCDEDMEVTVTG